MMSPGANDPTLLHVPNTGATLIAMAISMEREAAARYDKLAREMASSDNHELADLFDELGAEECKAVQGRPRSCKVVQGHRSQWSNPAQTANFCGGG